MQVSQDARRFNRLILGEFRLKRPQNSSDGVPLNKLWDSHTDVFGSGSFLAAGGGLNYRVRYLSQGDCIVWVVHILWRPVISVLAEWQTIAAPPHNLNACFIFSLTT